MLDIHRPRAVSSSVHIPLFFPIILLQLAVLSTQTGVKTGPCSHLLCAHGCPQPAAARLPLMLSTTPPDLHIFPSQLYLLPWQAVSACFRLPALILAHGVGFFVEWIADVVFHVVGCTCEGLVHRSNSLAVADSALPCCRVLDSRGTHIWTAAADRASARAAA